MGSKLGDTRFEWVGHRVLQPYFLEPIELIMLGPIMIDFWLFPYFESYINPSDPIINISANKTEASDEKADFNYPDDL